MKTFSSTDYNFQIDIPKDWSAPSAGLWGKLSGSGKDLLFNGPQGDFSVQVGPLTLARRPGSMELISPVKSLDIQAYFHPSEPSLEELRKALEQNISLDHGMDVWKIGAEDIGIIQIGGKNHLWAIHQVGRRLARTMPVSKKMLDGIRHAYRDIVGSLDYEFWLDEMYRHESAPTVKRYLLVFNGIGYDITCGLGLGTLEEVKREFKDKVEMYDDIISTFRLITVTGR